MSVKQGAKIIHLNKSLDGLGVELKTVEEDIK
jgi:hypothetical protein